MHLLVQPGTLICEMGWKSLLSSGLHADLWSTVSGEKSSEDLIANFNREVKVGVPLTAVLQAACVFVLVQQKKKKNKLCGDRTAASGRFEEEAGGSGTVGPW